MVKEPLKTVDRQLNHRVFEPQTDTRSDFRTKCDVIRFRPRVKAIGNEFFDYNSTKYIPGIIFVFFLSLLDSQLYVLPPIQKGNFFLFSVVQCCRQRD